MSTDFKPHHPVYLLLLSLLLLLLLLFLWDFEMFFMETLTTWRNHLYRWSQVIAEEELPLSLLRHLTKYM